MTKTTTIILSLALLASCGGRPVERTRTNGPDGALNVQDGGSAPKVTPVLTERVTCLFEGSATVQSCSSSRGKCSGVSSCTAVVSAPSGTPLTWSSTCTGTAKTIVDGQPETARFTCTSPGAGNITCVFLESKGVQQCYTATSGGDPLANSCSGAKSCSMQIPAKGKEMVFKSTCGGYAYALVDSTPKTIGFYCGTAQQTYEAVTCSFTGSAVARTCATSGLPGPFRCTGTGSCKVTVSGKVGTKLSWSSSCAGSGGTTTIDGVDDAVSFSCK